MPAEPGVEKLLGDAEVIARLRGYGEPKTLFGETTRTRQERLGRVELQQVGGLQDDDLLLQDRLVPTEPPPTGQPPTGQ